MDGTQGPALRVRSGRAGSEMAGHRAPDPGGAMDDSGPEHRRMEPDGAVGRTAAGRARPDHLARTGGDI